MKLEQLFRTEEDGKDRLLTEEGIDITDEVEQASGPKLITYMIAKGKRNEEEMDSLWISAPDGSDYYEKSNVLNIPIGDTTVRRAFAVAFYRKKE